MTLDLDRISGDLARIYSHVSRARHDAWTPADEARWAECMDITGNLIELIHNEKAAR